jgi:hypothetical protein
VFFGVRVTSTQSNINEHAGREIDGAGSTDEAARCLSGNVGPVREAD